MGEFLHVCFYKFELLGWKSTHYNRIRFPNQSQSAL